MAIRSVPTVVVNDIPYPIVPNTVKHKAGLGETKVNSASVGGGAVEIVVSEDAETKVSMVKFKMFTERKNEDAVKLWKQTNGANTVILTQPGEKPLSGTFMSVVNDPEWEDSAEGQTEIEMAGAPLS